MKVSVETPARLHFGVLNPSGVQDRGYGGVGLAIKGTGFKLEAERGDRLEIAGPRDVGRLARGLVQNLAKVYDLPTEVEIKILSAIPRHVGLGSTTQLTLALGKALTTLSGMKIPAPELAEKAGRGKHSGIGTYAFDCGGLVVDGGRSSGEFPPLIFRRNFPEEWHFVIAIPNVGKGPSERGEEKYFAQLGPEAEVSGEACYLLVMKMLPALVEHDIDAFGEALSEIDELVGKAFSSKQGGLFQSEAVSETRNYMLEAGAFGAGQSSWGPTIYGLTESRDHAKELEERMEGFMQRKDLLGDVKTAGPDNEGAKVEAK